VRLLRVLTESQHDELNEIAAREQQETKQRATYRSLFAVLDIASIL
jgi:hypothetical protein